MGVVIEAARGEQGLTDRFFLWEPPVAGGFLLSDEESHHFLRVLRGVPGDELILFDGTGWEALGHALGVEGGRVRVEIVEKREISREPRLCLDLAVAIPKGRRMEQMIRGLTELGVRRVFPLLPARGSVQPRPGAADRWRRVIIEAAKQCGRNLLLEVSDPQGLRELLTSFDEYSQRILLHPDSDLTMAQYLSRDGPPSSAIALIGPEGGFTPGEVGAALAAGFVAMRLSPSTLRLETAACAVAAAMLIAR